MRGSVVVHVRCGSAKIGCVSNKVFRKLAQDKRGVSALEYGLCAALIAFSTIAAVSSMSSKLIAVDNVLSAIYGAH